MTDLTKTIRDYSRAVNQLTYEINHAHEVLAPSELHAYRGQLKSARRVLRAERAKLKILQTTATDHAWADQPGDEPTTPTRPCAWCGKAPSRPGKATCSQRCSDEWNMRSV